MPLQFSPALPKGMRCNFTKPELLHSFEGRICKYICNMLLCCLHKLLISFFADYSWTEMYSVKLSPDCTTRFFLWAYTVRMINNNYKHFKGYDLQIYFHYVMSKNRLKIFSGRFLQVYTKNKKHPQILTEISFCAM